MGARGVAVLRARAGVEPLCEAALDLLLVGFRMAAPEIEAHHLLRGLEEVEGEAHALHHVGAPAGLAVHSLILPATYGRSRLIRLSANRLDLTGYGTSRLIGGAGRGLPSGDVGGARRARCFLTEAVTKRAGIEARAPVPPCTRARAGPREGGPGPLPTDPPAKPQTPARAF